jgi:Flp pilus assembly protein TadG
MSRHDGDRGAAAVELALVLPVLLLLVMGIIDFGMAYNRQISLSGGAREGARWLALHATDQTGAVTRTIDAGPAAPLLTTADVALCTGPDGGTCTSGAACASGLVAQVDATQPFDISIPFGPQLTVTLHGKAVMRCGG